MSKQKVLIDFLEYKRLKAEESKYHELLEEKKNQPEPKPDLEPELESEVSEPELEPESEPKPKLETKCGAQKIQGFGGEIAQLEKTVLMNENAENSSTTQQITDPITSPELPISDPPPKKTTSDPSEPKAEKEDGSSDFIDNWWFVGP